MPAKKRTWSPAQLAVRKKYFTPRKLEAQAARRKSATKQGRGNAKGKKQGRSK
jgi:hypothetical protein